MAAVEYEPVFWSAEGLARVRAALPADVDFSAQDCDLATFMYLEFQATVDNGTRRGVKADIRAMHREVLRIRHALAKPRMEILAAVGLRGGHSAIPRFTALQNEIAWLEESLAMILSGPFRRVPKSHPWYLLCAIAFLKTSFERATKVRATHSLHRDGQYVGEPLSPFGKFVVAVFAEIDPLLERRTIGSAIRKVFSQFHYDPWSFDEPADEIRITPH